MTTATRLSLLDRARLRDEQAWAELVDLYSPLMVAWCQRLRVGPEATADCIQDVFAAVSRSLDMFHPTGTLGAFRGWLWMVTRNKLRDAARREARHTSAIGGSTALARLHTLPDGSETLDPLSAIDVPDNEPSHVDDCQRLTLAALEQIRLTIQPQTWQAFWRCIVDGQSTAVVSQELGISAASVRQARCRVMQRLREQLGDSNGFPP